VLGVTSGMAMAYSAEGLRSGAAEAGVTAATAAEVAAALRPVTCDMSAFGLVAGAGAMAAAVLRSRDARTRVAEQAASVHTDVQGRAGLVAADGDDLTSRSSAVARQGAAGAGGG
jgi:hypothetical protein